MLRAAGLLLEAAAVVLATGAIATLVRGWRSRGVVGGSQAGVLLLLLLLMLPADNHTLPRGSRLAGLSTPTTVQVPRKDSRRK